MTALDVLNVSADPLRFMAGLETLASVDYSLCIKAGVHFTLCGGELPSTLWRTIGQSI